MNLNVAPVATNNFQVNKEGYFIFVRMDDLADMECVESDLLDAPRWDDSIYRCKEKTEWRDSLPRCYFSKHPKCGLNPFNHLYTPDSDAEFEVKTKAARHAIIFMMDKYDKDMEGSVTNNMHRRMVST